MTAAIKSTAESLQVHLAERDQKIVEQSAEILYLKEQNAWLLRQIFGKKSECVVDANQEQLKFDGFEAANQPKTETQTIPAHERKKRTSTGEDAIKLPDDLPVETTVIDIPEEEKVCKETGLPLQKIGEEVSHKLAHRPGSYFLKRIVRPKYAHPKQEEKGVITAPMPESLLPKCRADESLLADIITTSENMATFGAPAGRILGASFLKLKWEIPLFALGCSSKSNSCLPSRKSLGR